MFVSLLVLSIALFFVPLVCGDVGDGVEFGDGFDGLTPTPSPASSFGVSVIGSGLLSGLALFGVLPIAVGASVLVLVVRKFDDGSPGDLIMPIGVAVVAIVLVEVCLYVAVYLVGYLSF